MTRCSGDQAPKGRHGAGEGKLTAPHSRDVSLRTIQPLHSPSPPLISPSSFAFTTQFSPSNLPISGTHLVSSVPCVRVPYSIGHLYVPQFVCDCDRSKADDFRFNQTPSFNPHPLCPPIRQICPRSTPPLLVSMPARSEEQPRLHLVL